jgi:hypothetical protein
MSDTSPRDQAALRFGAKAPAVHSERREGELLFAFASGSHRYICELRTVPGYGVEAQFFLDGELLTAHTLPHRDLAIAWANETRKILGADAEAF